MIRLYIGDIHGDFTIAGKVYDHAVKNFLDGQIPDEIVQVGDYGFGLVDDMWRDEHNESYPLPGRKIFIDGNHEDHESLWSLHKLSNRLAFDLRLKKDESHFKQIERIVETSFHGWIYMSRGSVKDATCYLGGAASKDKKIRIARSQVRLGYISPKIWSKDEELTEQNINMLLDMYPDCNPFDTVVSHTFPSMCDMLWACNAAYGMDEAKDEQSRVQLQRVYDRFHDTIKLWIGGHWHRSRWWNINNSKFILLNTVSSLPSRGWEHLNECFYIEER